MFEQIMKIMDTNFTGISEIFVIQDSLQSNFSTSNTVSTKDYINSKTVIKIRNWQTDDIGTSNSKVYIKRFSSSPVTCEISFFSTLSDDETES